MALTNKIPRTKMILYTSLILIVWLMGFSLVFHDSLSTGMAVGLIVGLAFGSYYESYKVLETKQEITNPS